jgi:predicted nucleic acid-binding protein
MSCANALSLRLVDHRIARLLSIPLLILSDRWTVYRATSVQKRSRIYEAHVMARHVLVDAGFVVALLSSGDAHHRWAVTKAADLPPPWSTCEAVLSEAFHLLGPRGATALGNLLRRRALLTAFEIGENLEPVLSLMEKYSDVPVSLADACLVRMTETLADCVVLTTDHDFRVYRRHSRRVVPCMMPE